MLLRLIVGVYAFPDHVNDQDRISSIILNRDGFHKGDVVTITFPSPVVDLVVSTFVNL